MCLRNIYGHIIAACCLVFVLFGDSNIFGYLAESFSHLPGHHFFLNLSHSEIIIVKPVEFQLSYMLGSIRKLRGN